MAALSFASDSALVLQRGYTDEQEGWRNEAGVSTRLGEETETIYLAKWENGALCPWRADSDYPWQRIKEFTNIPISIQAMRQASFSLIS